MDKYKWDLTKFYKNKEEFNKEIEEVNRLLEELSKYKGKILESDKTLLEVLELDSKIDLLIERLYVYSFLGYYDNMEDPEFQDYKELFVQDNLPIQQVAQVKYHHLYMF